MSDFRSYELQYLGASMLSQISTGLGMLQKPLRDLYYAYQRPSGKIRLNSNLLTITERGLIVSQVKTGVGNEYSMGAEVFYEMPAIQLWDLVRFVAVKEKDKKYKCAFEPLNFDQNRSTENLFTPLDYKKDKHLTKMEHPSIFVIVLRRTTGLKALDLHAFICHSEHQGASLIQSLNMAHAAYRSSEMFSSNNGNEIFSTPSQEINFNHGSQSIYSGFGQPAMTSYGPDVYGRLPVQRSNGAVVPELNYGGYELKQSDLSGAVRQEPLYGRSVDYRSSSEILTRPMQSAQASQEGVYGRIPRPTAIGQENVYENNKLIYNGINNDNSRNFQQNSQLYPSPYNKSDNHLLQSLQSSNEMQNRKPAPVVRQENIYGKNFPVKQEENLINGNPYGGFPSKVDNSYGISSAYKRDEGIYGNFKSNVIPISENSKPQPFQSSANFNSGQPNSFVGFGKIPVNQGYEDDFPQRIKGTSPSYRRKFPSSAVIGERWKNEATPLTDVPVQSKFSNIPTSIPLTKPTIPAQTIPDVKPVHVQAMPKSPILQARSVPQNPVEPKPVQLSDTDEPPAPGMRKSVFGIFPRQPDKKLTSGNLSEKSMAPRQNSFDYNEKPVALVQPRKVQGIRVFPTGDDIYGKAPIQKSEFARPGLHQQTQMEVDNTDRPVKDKEIASMIGNINLDGQLLNQSQTNFEKSLGYLP